MTYQTADIDLAAALLAVGVSLIDVRSRDGIICEFVFPDHWGPGFEYPTEQTVAAFYQDRLMVDSRGITQQLRSLRIAIRRAQDTYRKDAKERAGIQP